VAGAKPPGGKGAQSPWPPVGELVPLLRRTHLAPGASWCQNRHMTKPQRHRTRIRLTVDLTPDVHATFVELAQATGIGIGRTIGDWLGDTQDAARHVASIVQEARKRPSVAASQLHSYASGLSVLTEQLLADVKKGREPAKPATAPEGAGAGVGGARRIGSPPVCNTGGKLPREGKR
jgi:hypothetical protein